MRYSKEKVASLLFLIGVIQFTVSLFIAEVLHPGYSLSTNYVSDLGIGPSAIIFNSSVILLGLLLLFGVYFSRQISTFRTVNFLLILMALSAVAVGIFTKDNPVAHGAVSSAAFFFAALSALSSTRVLNKRVSIISAVLGLLTIGALGLFSIGMVTSGSLTSTTAFDSIFYLGLGPGGMERMIIYPALLWLVVLSFYLAKYGALAA